MKKLMCLVLFLMMPVTAAFASAKTAEQFAQVDAQWNTLRLKGDATGLAALLADDFILTHSDGRVQYKADYVQELAFKTRTNSQIDNADLSYRSYGSTLIVTGASIQSGVSGGKPWEGKFRFTRVWVQAEGKWKLVSSHSSRISSQ